jgi:hypothetical protein
MLRVTLTHIMPNLSPDGEAALAVCQRLLDSLTLMGPEGRAQFVSTLARSGQACHARPSQDSGFRTITYEKNDEEFANRIPWESGDLLEEGIDDSEHDRQVVVCVDHDIAMVWMPFWFKRNRQLAHVGTSCFTLVKHVSDDSKGTWEWKIVGMTDTGRLPQAEDKQRLE